ncbi:hypothetical protein CR513_18452, partial [Mucuna pruriens]
MLSLHKKRHFKKYYAERRNKDSKKLQESDVLVVSNFEIEKDWMMDCGCTFHLCPRKDYFESLNLIKRWNGVAGK